MFLRIFVVVQIVVQRKMNRTRWLIRMIVCTVFVPMTVIGQGIETLCHEAEMHILANRTEQAIACHLQILEQDSLFHTSNVWLGNYYYLKGLEAVKEAEATYYRIAQPSHMQQARYLDELKMLHDRHFVLADIFLERALRVQSNDHLEQLQKSILAFRTRIGLVETEEKKTFFKALAKRIPLL